jgi:hypothetical protein
MANKNRLAQLEKARKAQADNGAVRIFVYRDHEDAGHCNGVQMSCAEWDKIKTDSDVTLVIRLASEAIRDGDE